MTDIGTADELLESASKLTGLSDFGDGDGFREGLDALLDSYREDEVLTPLGRKVARATVRSALMARLMSQLGWAGHPEVDRARITRPIFVTGLPRTGTTALHRLLCADPAHQGLEVWLTDVPQPRPPRASWDENPIYQQIKAGYERHHVDNPEFMGVHYISADSVEECWQLLRQSLRSVSFESLAHLPGYSAWLAQQDWTAAYQRHRRNLALIGLNDPDKRWVLKNPSHLFALDALLAVYPDAAVIVTHRDPKTIIASSCSLSAHASVGQSEVFTGETIGRDQLALWSRGARAFADARLRHDPAQFLDVRYEDFVADPLGTVQDVYDHFGFERSGAAREAAAAVVAEGSGAAAPRHSYDLADFGLTVADVEAAFTR
jgi:hypothetical protein